MGVVNLQRARAAKDRLVEVLGENPDVSGIGIARGVIDGYVLQVNLRTNHARSAIPPEIDGVTVRVQVVGRIRRH